MFEYFEKMVEWIRGTGVPEQIDNIDYMGLAHNPWFMVPFVALILYLIYKKEFAIVVIIAICSVCWSLTGTDYMKSLIVGGEIQVGKILPVVFGGAVALGAIIYLLINRD